MQLKDLFDYKNQLMSDLLTSPEIVALLDDQLDIADAEQLAYTQVFPYEYVPETIQEGKTYICFDVDVQKTYNKSFLEAVIYVWVFCHKHSLRLPEGGVRPDKLCCKICEKLNGSRMYGLGELDFSSMRRFAPMTDYLGKCMVFNATETNRQYDGSRPVPSNRKVG